MSDAGSLASVGSFPTLDNIYEDEEDSFISFQKRDKTIKTCLSSPEVKQNLYPNETTSNADEDERDETPNSNADKNIIANLYLQAELCRPSDDDIHEVTQSDVTEPTENRRRGFLQLIKVCLSKHPTISCAPSDSNQAASNTAAAEPDANNNEESSLVDTMDDADLPTATDNFRLGIAANPMNDDTDDDSTYDLYASTLSRASASTKASTVGDAIIDTLMRESKLASDLTKARAARRNEEESDNQTLSTYSYRRAYADNITLGSAHTSNVSTITNDYSYDTKRRIGMAEAVRPTVVVKSPVDMDTGKPVVATKDEESAASSSFPAPPPIFRLNDASNFNLYESNENLHRIVSFGEGEGYVHEEEAERFTSLRRRQRGSSGCRSWFSSAPRAVKVMIAGSILLFLVSIASVSIGIMLQQEGNEENPGFVAISNSITGDRVAEDIMDTEGPVPSLAPTATMNTSTGAVSSSTLGPSLRPSQAPSNIRTTKPSLTVEVVQTSSPVNPTPAPSKPVTKAPTLSPSNVPTTPQPSVSLVTKTPTLKPTNEPILTQSPTAEPTPAPSSPSPSAQPVVATLNPSPLPTRSPTPPPSPVPTTRAPFHADPSLTWMIIRAAQDTYISANSPGENFGTSTKLRVDESPERRALIGFDTSRLTNIRDSRHETPLLGNDEPRKLIELRILDAKLRLFSIDDGGSGSVYFLPNTKKWDETLVTATSMGNAVNASGGVHIASYGNVTAFRWYEIDVTEAFKGGAADLTTFAMFSESSDGVSFASKERAEGVLAPEIVFAIKSTGTFAPTDPGPGRPTYSPTTMTSGDPSPKPSQKPTQRPTGRPTNVPTAMPSDDPPSRKPTQKPTGRPTNAPTAMPSDDQPTQKPTRRQTYEPTAMPSDDPSPKPSRQPTQKPTEWHLHPTEWPTYEPTQKPTKWPTYEPTTITSEDSSPRPSRKPTQQPTPNPTPIIVTTILPTKQPSSVQTKNPTQEPTSSPQMQTPEPTDETSDGTTTKETEIDPTWCGLCPPSGTLFVAGSNCSGFWWCADGVRQHYHSCPEGTIFNNLLQICDHPHSITCSCNPL